MGYKPVSKLLDLEFVDYPGLEIRTRSASIAEIKKAQDLNIDVNRKGASDEEKLEAFSFFEKKIVKWNMEHPELEVTDENDPTRCAFCGLKEDDPMPPTMTSMMCLDFGLMIAVIFGWIRTVAQVSIPKELSTNNGAMSGPGMLLRDGVETETMRKLEALQNPGILPMPNLSLD